MFTPRGPLMIKVAQNQCDWCSPILVKKSTGTSIYIFTVSQSPLAFPYCEFLIYFFICYKIDVHLKKDITKMKNKKNKIKSRIYL